MNAFRKFIEELGAVWALVLVGGVLSPVVASFAGLAPQGQSSSPLDMGLLSGFVALLTVLAVWTFARRLGPRVAKAGFALALLVAAASLTGYWIQMSSFQQEYNGHKFIAGCEWNPDMASLLKPNKSQCPGEARHLLDEEGARPQDIWTEASTKAVERQLVGLWALVTASWLAMVSFFVVAIVRRR